MRVSKQQASAWPGNTATPPTSLRSVHDGTHVSDKVELSHDGSVAEIVCGRMPALQTWRKFLYMETLVNGRVLGSVDHFPGADYSYL